MYAARVLADSITLHDIRLITVEVTFPRFILAEVNTHRMFSRNSASSRAIPPEQQIARVKENPFIPEAFHLRTKGMGQGQALDERGQEISETAWLRARDAAVVQAEVLVEAGVSKAHVNRLLEPFMWHTAIITSTEWENFFALRCPPGYEVDYDFPAQPEFQKTALAMREVMRASTPMEVRSGEWHLPLMPEAEGTQEVSELEWEQFAMVSAGRCARVSFDTHENYEDAQISYDRALNLKNNGHLSPFEHAATPGETELFYENLRGWKSYRHIIPHQENRVGYIEKREPWDHAGLPEHQPAMGGEV